MRISFRPAVPAALAVVLGAIWVVLTTPSGLCPGVVVVVNDEAVTCDEIEQRARLLALSANITEQAKANFQRLVKSEALEAKLKQLQDEVIRSNPGKTREQPIAIMQERQKQIGLALQKQAVERARAALMPKMRKDAREGAHRRASQAAGRQAARHHDQRRGRQGSRPGPRRPQADDLRAA